ncbi:hypothetical protein V0M98_34365 (plasmid) [Pseudomonas silesiensis]|uniref:hypothetical protein n=1 Tax=Pseudomonas silesiensis TaxID=1853130 RepID=UPI0030CFC58F
MSSGYFAPLVTRPDIVTAPGEYFTRKGERVVVTKVSTHHDFGCVGAYVDCGTRESWHKSGRIRATSETLNDIVRRAE